MQPRRCSHGPDWDERYDRAHLAWLLAAASLVADTGVVPGYDEVLDRFVDRLGCDADDALAGHVVCVVKGLVELTDDGTVAPTPKGYQTYEFWASWVAASPSAFESAPS